MNAMFRALVKFLPIVGFAAFGVLGVTPANASHSWGNYHWASTSGTGAVSLTVIDSNTSDWDDNLDAAIPDWDASGKLTLSKQAGDTSSKTRRRCSAETGKVRSCNLTYGFNGWLGIATIWVSDGHIVKANTKVNDSYLNSGSYSETNRQHVICQEIGHDFGLDHQDESGADLNTCMDYSNNLDNPDPNAHDYEQLEIIYSHSHSTLSVGGGPGNSGGNGNADEHIPAGVDEHFLPPWASPAAGDVYEVDLGNGVRIITHVTWARGGPGARPN